MLFIVPKYSLWFSCPQLGILYVAAALRKAGVAVEIADAAVEPDFYAGLDRKIAGHDLVGITANVSHARSAVEIAAYIRKKHPSKKIVWGGPYPSAEYDKLIPELADIVVVGEGETQTVEICLGTQLSDIQSIAYYENGALKVNPRRSYIENLDALEFPAWELADVRRYNFPGKIPGYLMQTQRGCPFNCANCTTFIHGNRYRTRSVESVFSEIVWLYNSFGAKEIHFWDDNFTLSPERVKSLCERIISGGMDKIRYTLPNGIRADINDPEMFRLMRRAGFYYVNVAVESGDQEVINKLGKNLDLGKVRETVESLDRCGFRIGLLFMMGMPYDTPATLEKTAKFAASLPAHHAHFFIVTPFPGTKLYDDAVATGKFIKKYDNEPGLSFDDESERFVNPNLSNCDLRRFHHLAYRKFYNPGRIARTASRMIGQGNFFTDMKFLIKCGAKILSSGHR